MRSIRRVGALAVAGVLLSAVASGSAGAATPAAYTGSASAYALQLAVGPQNLTAGSSSAAAASTGTAEATGAGVLSPAQASTIATVKNPPGGTVPEKCGDDPLNAVETALRDILKLGLGCGSASATGTDLTTVASATGKVGQLNLNVAPIAQALPVTPQLVSGIGQVTTTVDTICKSLPASPLPLPGVCQSTSSTIDTLIQSLTATSLLSGELGTSASSVTVPGGTSVITESTASGAVIKVVPTPTLDGVALPEALLTITVSRANARVVCDLSSGNAAPSFDPAIVRVKLGAPLAGVLPVNLPDPFSAITLPPNPVISGVTDPKVQYVNGELTITPGSTVTLLAGTPAETQIVVGDGSSKVNPDRSSTASADGVRIHALRNIGTAVAPLTGGVLLNLAHAEAAAGCVAATADTATPATPTITETPRELPRTGGSTPWLPIAGAAALAVAVVTRRALVRAN